MVPSFGRGRPRPGRDIIHGGHIDVPYGPHMKMKILKPFDTSRRNAGNIYIPYRSIKCGYGAVPLVVAGSWRRRLASSQRVDRPGKSRPRASFVIDTVKNVKNGNKKTKQELE